MSRSDKTSSTKGGIKFPFATAPASAAVSGVMPGVSFSMYNQQALTAIAGANSSIFNVGVANVAAACRYAATPTVSMVLRPYPLAVAANALAVMPSAVAPRLVSEVQSPEGRQCINMGVACAEVGLTVTAIGLATSYFEDLTTRLQAGVDEGKPKQPSQLGQHFREFGLRGGLAGLVSGPARAIVVDGFKQFMKSALYSIKLGAGKQFGITASRKNNEAKMIEAEKAESKAVEESEAQSGKSNKVVEHMKESGFFAFVELMAVHGTTTRKRLNSVAKGNVEIAPGVLTAFSKYARAALSGDKGAKAKAWETLGDARRLTGFGSGVGLDYARLFSAMMLVTMMVKTKEELAANMPAPLRAVKADYWGSALVFGAFTAAATGPFSILMNRSLSMAYQDMQANGGKFKRVPRLSAVVRNTVAESGVLKLFFNGKAIMAKTGGQFVANMMVLLLADLFKRCYMDESNDAEKSVEAGAVVVPGRLPAGVTPSTSGLWTARLSAPMTAAKPVMSTVKPEPGMFKQVVNLPVGHAASAVASSSPGDIERESATTRLP